MSLAYHLLAHKDAPFVQRLFKAIWHPDDLFVIHFDQRSPEDLRVLGEALARDHENVLLQAPRAVLWGGPEISNVQLEGIDLALSHGDKWSHLLNITGQDFPLTDRATRLKQIAPEKNLSYVHWFAPLESEAWSNARERVEGYHLRWLWLHKLLAVPGFGRRLRWLLGWQYRKPCIPFYRRSLPPFMKYRGGSNYGAFTREACQYLVHDKQAQAINHWLQHSGHANEIVFQSILLSGPFAERVVNRNWHYIDFPKHSPHPKTISMEHQEALAESDALFARKFNSAEDSAIIDVLERKLVHAPKWGSQ